MVFSFETNWTPWSLAPLQFIKKNGGEFIKRMGPEWGPGGLKRASLPSRE